MSMVTRKRKRGSGGEARSSLSSQIALVCLVFCFFHVLVSQLAQEVVELSRVVGRHLDAGKHLAQIYKPRSQYDYNSRWKRHTAALVTVVEK
jgi:hypothetical protein